MWSIVETRPPSHRTTNSYLFNLIRKRLKIKHFRGTFPCDLMPRKLSDKQCIIVNTDPHHSPGAHYIVLYRKLKKYYYFDSLCLDPEMVFPSLHREILARGFTPLQAVLAKPIQAITSSFCGYFCVDYILTIASPQQALKNSNCYVTDQSNLLANDRICIDNITDYITRNKKRLK